MTQSTEQLHQLLELVLTELDRMAIPIAYMQGIDRKGKAFIEQAARRTQVVPKGWRLVPIEPTEEMIEFAEYGDKEYSKRAFGGAIHIPQGPYDHWVAMLAAAPQPPEAAQLDDINVADIAQVVDSKDAAPVQMPEPVAVMTDTTPREPSWRTMFVPDAGTKLYTEQQVRQLLAAHGIK